MFFDRIIFFVIFYLFISCNDIQRSYSSFSGNNFENSTLTKSNSDIKIGIGIHGFNLKDSLSKKLKLYFNSLSTANAMKFEAIHPHLDEYYWNEADSLIDFATSNGMFVRGHTLLWSNRNPYWLFWDEKGNLVHRKLLDQRLKEHIHAVVSRYRGKVYAWDVVNEAIYDNDKEFLKPNGWYKIMGAEYIKKAFIYTHEADSNAILFYNDYDAEQPDKLKRIVKLIKWLQSENVPIHGIGIQAHWTLDIPKISDLKAAIDEYSSLGLQVQLTELDITIPADFKGSGEEKMELLSARYAEIFRLLSEQRSKLSGITFWQTSDSPMKYPPILDSQLNPTPVYHALINAWSKN